MKLEANMKEWLAKQQAKRPLNDKISMLAQAYGKQLSSVDLGDMLHTVYGDRVREQLTELSRRNAEIERRQRLVEDIRGSLFTRPDNQEISVAFQSAFRNLSRDLYGDWYGDGTRTQDEDMDQGNTQAAGSNVGRR